MLMMLMMRRCLGRRIPADSHGAHDAHVLGDGANEPPS